MQFQTLCVILQNNVSLQRRLIESGFRTRRRDTFFCVASATAPALLYLLHPCSRKESIQRKGDPDAAYFLRSSLSPGVAERGSCPFVNVRHPCRTPNGLFPAKAPVLGAAYGIESVPLASFDLIGPMASRQRKCHRSPNNNLQVYQPKNKIHTLMYTP